MKNTENTANVWTFAPDAVTVNGRTFPATYSVARGGDVYVFTTLEGAPIRVHIGLEMPMHAAAVAAAQPKAEKPVEPKPEKPTQPKAEKPAEKTWIGSTITGAGWSIVFDEALKRTRVLCEHPTDAQKSAIEDAGFYWSATMGSWNKKLTVKAYRAAQELAAKLNKLAA